MDPNRKRWNERHQQLHQALDKGDRNTAIELFLCQHAMVHSAKVSNEKIHSFADELLKDLDEEAIRQIPAGSEHSIAWILFHLARIEDITMNILVAGTEQLFTQDMWAQQLNTPIYHSANHMSPADVAELNTKINIKCLSLYRAAVGKRTRLIVQKLQAEDFKRTVDPARLERILKEGAVTSGSMEIIDYWSKKTMAGLLLMPPTRHCILHLNEAMQIKKKIRKKVVVSRPR